MDSKEVHRVFKRAGGLISIMADIKSREARSKNMSAIKGKDTKPEVITRKYLFSQGFRYRKNVSKLPGKPDIVLAKYKTVVFVNGCFWHYHEGCKYFVWPKQNAAFWKDKITDNVSRDKRNYKTLEEMGWRVITIWECELKHSRIETLEKLSRDIKDFSGCN